MAIILETRRGVYLDLYIKTALSPAITLLLGVLVLGHVIRMSLAIGLLITRMVRQSFKERIFVRGLGPALIFRTASEAVLGQGKFQAGPAGEAAYLGKDWILGLFRNIERRKENSPRGNRLPVSNPTRGIENFWNIFLEPGLRRRTG